MPKKKGGKKKGGKKKGGSKEGDLGPEASSLPPPDPSDPQHAALLNRLLQARVDELTARCSDLAMSNAMLTTEKNELKRHTHELIRTVNDKTEQDRVSIERLQKACAELTAAKTEIRDDCDIRLAEQGEEVEIMERQVRKLRAQLADREFKLSNHQKLVGLNGSLNDQVHGAVRERDELFDRLQLYERQAGTLAVAGRGLVPLVVEGMRRFAHSAGLVRDACCAVLPLLHASASSGGDGDGGGGSASAAITFVSAGGVELLAQALGDHERDAGVVQAAARLLCKLANTPSARVVAALLEGAGAVRAVLRSMCASGALDDEAAGADVMDKDGDGIITGAEGGGQWQRARDALTRALHALLALARFDKDGDGNISHAEFISALSAPAAAARPSPVLPALGARARAGGSATLECQQERKAAEAQKRECEQDERSTLGTLLRCLREHGDDAELAGLMCTAMARQLQAVGLERRLREQARSQRARGKGAGRGKRGRGGRGRGARPRRGTSTEEEERARKRAEELRASEEAEMRASLRLLGTAPARALLSRTLVRSASDLQLQVACASVLRLAVGGIADEHARAAAARELKAKGPGGVSVVEHVLRVAGMNTAHAELLEQASGLLRVYVITTMLTLLLPNFALLAYAGEDTNATLLRPNFHFLPSASEQNWINDPNGPFWDEASGLFHMFFQYRTPRTWGHAVSANMVDFTELPVALTYDVNATRVAGGRFRNSSEPTETYHTIPDGVYSGSATLLAGTPWLSIAVPANDMLLLARPADPTDKYLRQWEWYDRGEPVIYAKGPGTGALWPPPRN
eukprot:g6856.t1